MLLIPIILFLITTGGYFGIFLSSIFLMGIFIVLQIINGFWKGIGKKKSIGLGITTTSLMVLGLLMLTIYLGPFLQYGSELSKIEPDESRWQSELRYQQFPGFFMSNKAIPDSREFSSTFLTLPILILASFVPLSYIKKYWIFFIIFIVAFLMALGKPSFLYQILSETFPLLAVSRFPVGDYRIFIAIPLVIFALIGLKAIIEGKFTWKTFFLRTAFIFSWFSYGIFVLLSFGNSSKWIDDSYNIYFQPIFATLILGISISLVAYCIIKFKTHNSSQSKQLVKSSIILLIIFVLIIVVDGFVVINDMKYVWVEEPFDKHYKEVKGISLEIGERGDPHKIFENLPEERPQRVPYEGFLGVLTGDYATVLHPVKQDNLLKAANLIKSNEIYMDFMFKEWTPILLEPPESLDYSSKVYLPDELFSNLDIKSKDDSVIQTFYGINDITYKISLNEPKLMVENEIYFPGWTATLIYPDKEIQLESIQVNDAFRSWNLPQGEYEMKANFQFPNLVIFQVISLIALVIWIVFAIVFLKKTDHKNWRILDT